MISVYAPEGDEGYELCQPAMPGGFVSLNSSIVEGLYRADQMPSMEIIRNDEGVDLLHSDSPWLGSQALVFRESVVDAMKDVLRSTRLLKFYCDSDCLYLCNPPIATRALNETKSLVDRFSDGRIMRIERHVFVPDALYDYDVFRISNVRVSSIFVSQRFVDVWRSLGFVGLNFKLLWTADQSGMDHELGPKELGPKGPKGPCSN